MLVLSTDEIKRADAFTIKNEPVHSVDLMERAATACCNWIKLHIEKTSPIIFLCGTGNNGGDGVALARLLFKDGYSLKVYCIGESKKFSEDAEINFRKLNDLNIPVLFIQSGKDIPPFKKDEIIIDAIFGTGLNKPVSGIYEIVLNAVNQSESKVISLDIPSGLFADQSSTGNTIIKADYTLTFEYYKLAFLFRENAGSTGEIIVLPIGIHPEFENTLSVKKQITEKNSVKQIIKTREPFSHKGTFGHALIVAGSFGKIGAAVLCTKACLRTGAGLVSVHVPECGYEILQVTVPEAMVLVDENERIISSNFSTEKYAAIGIGPGIDTNRLTVKFVKKMLLNCSKPVVIDADAINILAQHRKWLSFVPEHSVLTPHPKEFERIAGKTNNDFERHALQIEFSVKNKVYVILKGRFTCITCPDGKCYFNSTGNAGMAKGGSGDVLTGMITALLAQGYSPEESCVAGVYLHGLAGDIAAEKFGENSMMAGDIIENIGEAFLNLQNI